MSEQLSALLEPVAAWFRGFNMPEPIIHWGHPLMMGIVIFVMGSFVGWAGWRGRTLIDTDKEAALKSRADHRKLAPLMTLFITMGYTGGLLSLVMQGQPILQSPHFWTGSAVVLLLWSNGLMAFLGFNKDDGSLRTVHAYLGSAALALMVVHALFGLKLGLSI